MENNKTVKYDMFDLKFLTDTCSKLESILEHIEDNMQFNVESCNRDEDDLNYQYNSHRDIRRVIDDMDCAIMKEFGQHPLQSWIGIDGFNPVLMGKIAGSIRFSPPKRNTTSNSTGRERWAHSEGALLTFCGLENRNNKNIKANRFLNKYIMAQVIELTAENYSYRELNYKYTTTLEEALPNASAEYIKSEALRNTAVYFMKEIYNYMTQTEDVNE